MNDLADQLSPPPGKRVPSMSALITGTCVAFSTMVIILLIAMLVHLAVEHVYESIEDECFAGVCVDRVPQGP